MGVALTAMIVPFAVAGAIADPPIIAPAYQGKLVIEAAGDVGANVTQMVFGPDSRLYVMTREGGFRFKYNSVTGQLTDKFKATGNLTGIGIAFHTNKQGKSAMYVTAEDPANAGGNAHNNSCNILKLTDDNGNGVWGEASETNVKLVTGLPIGDHAVDQLLVQGDTLYVGIGIRTINGRKGNLTAGSLDDFGGQGFWSGGNGNTFGDSAYGGTISYIEDLNTVIDAQDSANAYAPNTTRNQTFYQDNALPYTIELTLSPQTLARKLRIHSAGTRNPFGLAFNKTGDLYFTNNFNRVQTNGDGSAGFGYLRDNLDDPANNSDFTKDVYDQVFKAKKGADYGYSNQNWRNKSAAPILNAAAPGYFRVNAVTYDNLYNKGPYFLHDPANPDGMGPHASADGCAFFYAPNLPSELYGNLFVTRYTGFLRDNQGNSVEYRDVTAVDTLTGKVRRIAQNFTNPVCALSDNAQRLLIGDISTGKIWAIRAAVRGVSATAALTRLASPSNIRAVITLRNFGDIALNNVVITGVKLNGKATTDAVSPLPTLNSGISASRTVVFPASSATVGQASILTVKGTFDGGSFSISQRVTAP